jgi:hypothetical protein
VDTGTGVGLIAGGSVLGLVVGLVGWRRLSPVLAQTAMAVIGVAVGSGALLVQDEASAADWALTLVVLGVLTPVHARFVFGRPGERA